MNFASLGKYSPGVSCVFCWCFVCVFCAVLFAACRPSSVNFIYFLSAIPLPCVADFQVDFSNPIFRRYTVIPDSQLYLEVMAPRGHSDPGPACRGDQALLSPSSTQSCAAAALGNTKECSNYCTIAFMSHASKGMLKIFQAKLQQYMNWKLPDVQVGFRKGRGTRDQITSIRCITEKATEFQRNI